MKFQSIRKDCIEEIMGWLVRLYQSSVGKKSIMAVSGILLVLFLFTHMLGNSTTFLGRTAFNSYAEKLHSLGGLVYLFLKRREPSPDEELGNDDPDDETLPGS